MREFRHGTMLVVTCERCGAESPTGFSFCGACGARLTDAQPDRAARKIVTALFCDLAGSTALAEQLDPEAFRSVLNRYFDAISTTIGRHGGTVQKFAGDAVLAVFGVPLVHEDDALRAVRAAVEIRDQLPSLADDVGLELHFRIGVNTGLVVTDHGKSLALGDAVNVAARLEQAAPPGQILIGADTFGLVRDAVEAEPLAPIAVKGKSQPLNAFRVLAIDPIAPGFATRSDVSLIDRHAELALLREAWATVCERSEVELVTILGTAGVGKSRLAQELLAETADVATTLSGRCLHYGEGITFWPMIEALAPLGDRAATTLRHLSRGGAATPEELFWEVRRLLETVAATRPVILHVDDLQWAEPMLLELLEHIVGLSSGAPIMVIVTARSDLSGWEADGPRRTTITLEPLASDDCERLLDELGEPLEADARAQVITASEGNPLFLQEMAVLAGERGAVDIPPTIQALLSARIEQLSPDQREVLTRGAIEGQVFHRDAVSALASGADESALDAHLGELIEKDLIRPDPGNLSGGQAFRFRHLLIRDAAYERLSKATRAELHARYASWLEGTDVEFAEVDEIAGWHLEQAVRNAHEVRRRPDAALSRRAAEHLYAAGRRAGDRSDLAAARNLLERAFALAANDELLHADVGGALAERLIEAGDLDQADRLLREIETDDHGLGAQSISRLEWLVFSDPAEAKRMIDSVLPSMLERLAGSGDDRAQAKVHWLAFWAHWSASQATPAGEQARLTAEHAKRAGDTGLWSRALGWYVGPLIYGPASATEMASELGAIEQQDPGPYLRGFIDLAWSEVKRLGGDLETARIAAASAFDGFAALGLRTLCGIANQSMATAELTAGDAAAARTVLERSEALLAESRERFLRSTTQAMLARAHVLLGDLEAALAAAELSDQLSAPQDLLNFILTHGVRSRLAQADGDLAAAERWARSAVGVADRTDFTPFQAQARLGLAEVVAARGRSGEAAGEAQAALELYRRKGDRLGENSARSLLDEIRPHPDVP